VGGGRAKSKGEGAKKPAVGEVTFQAKGFVKRSKVTRRVRRGGNVRSKVDNCRSEET